jgi:hypothetical protein
MNQSEFISEVEKVSPKGAAILRKRITGPDADIKTLQASGILNSIFYWDEPPKEFDLWYDIYLALKGAETNMDMKADEAELKLLEAWVPGVPTP